MYKLICENGPEVDFILKGSGTYQEEYFNNNN